MIITFNIINVCNDVHHNDGVQQHHIIATFFLHNVIAFNSIIASPTHFISPLLATAPPSLLPFPSEDKVDKNIS